MTEIDKAFLFGMLAGVGVGAFLSVAIAEIRYKITDMRWRKQKGAEDENKSCKAQQQVDE